MASTAAVAASSGSARARSFVRTPRALARRLVLARWHSTAEWRALDEIVTPESRWQPCAVYPSRLDCSYAGASSCGIPQAQPCPALWRGRLRTTWQAQVRWLIGYVARRYGSPSQALAFRRANGWY